MDQKLFMDMISDLRDLAASQKGRLLRSQVEEQMCVLQLNISQMESVFEYLKAHNISVTDSLEEPVVSQDGTDKKENSRVQSRKSARMQAVRQGSLGVTEKELYHTYMRELEQLGTCSLEEEALLLEKVVSGDELAKNRLIESNLHLVAEWAEQFTGQGVAVTDLIQEGNMALVQFVQTTDGVDFRNRLYQEVRHAMQLLVDMDRGNANVKEVMVNRANRLLEVSAELAEELEREPTLAELAEKLHLSEDEVTQVMKMSMEAMNVEENGFGGFGGR